MRDGQFYRLDGTAALIWDRLDGIHDTAALARDLAGHFDVDEETCRGDIETFCLELEALGFAERAEGAA